MPENEKNNRESRMAVFVLENDEIRIKVNSRGAELRSLEDKKSGREYMWYGDAEYWGRVSPSCFRSWGLTAIRKAGIAGRRTVCPSTGLPEIWNL